MVLFFKVIFNQSRSKLHSLSQLIINKFSTKKTAIVNKPFVYLTGSIKYIKDIPKTGFCFHTLSLNCAFIFEKYALCFTNINLSRIIITEHYQ